MYSAAYLATYHLMPQSLVMSRPLRLLFMCIYIVICVKVVTLTALSRVELKNTLSGNFQKSEIHVKTYTGNFDMYDTPSER